MKLYIVRYEDECSGSGYTAVWKSSKRDARRERARLKKLRFRDISIYADTLKLRKDDILEFLNRHADIC